MNELLFKQQFFSEEVVPIVVKLIHSNPETKIFWYLNEKYLGLTQEMHEIDILPKKGQFLLTALDEFGNEFFSKIEIKN